MSPSKQYNGLRVTLAFKLRVNWNNCKLIFINEYIQHFTIHNSVIRE
jgi:hypothetical protein